MLGKKAIFKGITITIAQKKALLDLEKEAHTKITTNKRDECWFEAENAKVFSLQLTRAGLKKLPGSICNLKHLIILDIGYNELTDLPESLLSIPGLRMVRVQGNPLSEAAKQIAKQLNRRRSVAGNNLVSIPASIQKMKTLKLLYLRGNKSLKLPDSLKNKRYVIHGTCRENIDVAGKKIDISLFRELLRWYSSNDTDIQITGQCVDK